MNNKIIIGSAALVTIALLLLAFALFSGRGDKKSEDDFSKQRENILKIIARYYDKEEYERALNQIEELLRINIDDEEALLLQDKIIEAKNRKEQNEENRRRQDELRDKEKLFSSVNSAIERKDEKPVIIRKETAETVENSESAVEETDSKIDKKNKEKADSKEAEKKKKINELITEGINEYNNQNYARAKDKLLKALDLEPDNAEANAILSATLFDENPDDPKSIEEAVSRAQKALKKDENSELAHLTLAKIYAKRGMKDQAIEEYNKAVKINPNNYDAFYNLGKLYFLNKEYTKAENSFKSAVAIKKDFVNGYFYLGLTQYKLNNKTGSINSYQTAVKLDPAFFEAYVNLGEIYRLDNNPQDALGYYQKAAAINNKFSIQKKIGESYEALKKYNEAYDSYLLSVSLNPQSNTQEKKSAIESYVSLAHIRNLQGKYQDALDTLQKGLEIDPENPNLNFMGGFSSDKLSNSQEAERYYLKTLEAHKGYTEAYINLSSIYNATGRYAESVSLLQTGVSHDATNFALFNNLGDALQKLAKYNDAIDNYKKAISLNSQEPAIYFNMGLCYKSLNNHDNAIIVLKRAIELNKNYFDCYYEIGESFFIKQDYENAKSFLSNLLKLKPDYIHLEKINSMLTVMG